MPSKPKTNPDTDLIAEWTLPAAATLGSSVRARGILLEIRARLPQPVKKLLDVRGGVLVLSVPETSSESFKTVSDIVAKTLVGIEAMPVIPREIEDILGIKTSERHRWLKDGRLQSAGTRTVKLRGRAKKITFHVFEPSHVEEILNRDLTATWREEDAETAAENRRRAAWNRKLVRAEKAGETIPAEPGSGRDAATGQKLQGWEAFEREGLLR